MRVLSMCIQGLLSFELIQELRRIPYFNGQKTSGVYHSNKLIYDRGTSSPSHALIGHRGISEITMQTNVVAFYDKDWNLYWVEKNSYTGELGWLSKEDFKSLVDKEFE